MSKQSVGRNFGSYWIRQKLGSGGMATVFHAVSKETGQSVALKVLHEQYNDDEHIRKRFEREARIAAKLEHPNIVPIWDFGVFNHRVYLVMPLMKGGNYANALSKAGGLHYRTSLDVLAILADALDYAHSKQVVHRDFKLENILINEQNIPAISDFGIAQAPDISRITMTGQILGSPQYVAPENFYNETKPDYRQDLYAFAITAYLLLTGYFPFTGKAALPVLEKQRNALPPKPSLVNPDVPKMLDTVFAKALAKDPDERFVSAHELVYGLDAAFIHAPDGFVKIHLDDDNPVKPERAEAFNAFLTLIGPTAINLNEISKAETMDIRGPLPAYEKPREKKSNRLLWPFLFVCLILVALVIALAAERTFARTNIQNTFDAFERVGDSTTANPTANQTALSPSPVPSMTAAINTSRYKIALAMVSAEAAAYLDAQASSSIMLPTSIPPTAIPQNAAPRTEVRATRIPRPTDAPPPNNNSGGGGGGGGNTSGGSGGGGGGGDNNGGSGGGGNGNGGNGGGNGGNGNGNRNGNGNGGGGGGNDGNSDQGSSERGGNEGSGRGGSGGGSDGNGNGRGGSGRSGRGGS